MASVSYYKLRRLMSDIWDLAQLKIRLDLTGFGGNALHPLRKKYVGDD